LAAKGRPFAEATLAELQGISPLFDDGYYTVVDLERVVAAKVSPGGTAPERIAEQLTLARGVLARLGAQSPSAAPNTAPHSPA
jgi:argininosuccinate lyase